MSKVKFATLLDSDVKKKLDSFSSESHQSISGIVNDALMDYFKRKAVRTAFKNATEQVISENRELLARLAK